jgi:hypothetical protein
VIAGLNFWLFTRTKDRLDTLHRRLDRLGRFLIAGGFANSIEDPEAKAKALVALARTVATTAVEVRLRSD